MLCFGAKTHADSRIGPGMPKFDLPSNLHSGKRILDSLIVMPPPLPPGQLGHSLGPRDACVTLGGHLDYVVRTRERAGTRASST